MARSKWKCNFISYKLVKNILLNPTKNVFQIKDRNSTVYPLIYKKPIEVYNGKVFNPVVFDEDHRSFKIGCFSNTRAFPQHKKKDKKKK